MNKVLLVSMPFGAMERPALGLSLLRARLASERVECDVRYLTFAFAEYIGHDTYQWMTYHLPYTAFAGDWTFTAALYGERPDVDRAYQQSILRDTWRLAQQDIDRILHVRSFVPHFLAYCLAAVPWHEYAMVGFTSTFEQNIASLALARRIKRLHPEIKIVFGGANWEGEMGHELHRQFGFVDYVCSGEAENSLIALVRHVLDRRADDDTLATIPGLVHRSKDCESVATPSSEPIRDLDSLPYPDFVDYFRDLAQCTVSAPIVPTLLFETSRGCWWGAKSHCTFCGLNGQTMAFRSKSPGRALEELEYLIERWRLENVEAVDNILDMRYFNDLLPTLARRRGPLQLFYEVKANLTKAQVKTLHEAGVCRIQPGIESLSDHVLKLMRKGTTALRNIQLLKWAQQFQVTVEWNILYGFPGETREDYSSMLAMLPAIRFLRPPCATGPIRLDRFSPYHTSPAAFGLSNVRPMAIYSYLYPFAPESLRRIAYYFDFDYAADADPTGYAADVIAYAAFWQRDTNRGTLTYVTAPDGRLTLLDTRPERTIAQLTLRGLERAAYEYCDELHAVAGVTRHLHDRFPDVDFTEAQVRGFLDSLVANRLMVTDGANYLSLAICADLNDATAADGLASNHRAIETQGLDPWRVIQRA
jgi:ribosomal peptide maturation radical SAM protein 1